MWNSNYRAKAAQGNRAKAMKHRIDAGLHPDRELHALGIAWAHVQAGEQEPRRHLTPEERYGRDGGRYLSRSTKYRYGVSYLLYEQAFKVCMRIRELGKRPIPGCNYSLDLVDSPARAPKKPRLNPRRTGDTPVYEDDYYPFVYKNY